MNEEPEKQEPAFVPRESLASAARSAAIFEQLIKDFEKDLPRCPTCDRPIRKPAQ